MVCGNCDNCRRDPESIITRNVTANAWRVLKVVKEVESDGGRVTLTNLADLVRGLAGGSYAIPADGSSRKRKAEPTKGQVNVSNLTGGKVDLNKEVCTASNPTSHR